MATTPQVEREKRYLKRGEVTLQGFPFTNRGNEVTLRRLAKPEEVGTQVVL
jgi:hypothetical protein